MNYRIILSILITGFILLAVQHTNLETVWADVVHPLQFPVRTESEVDLPHPDMSAPSVNIADDRFDTEVHALGWLWDSLLAVHPVTNDLFFSDLDTGLLGWYGRDEYSYFLYYSIVNKTVEERNQLYGRNLFRIPGDSHRVIPYSVSPLFAMPEIDDRNIYPKDMEIDSEGNVFLIDSENCVLQVEPDLTSRIIYTSAGDSLSNLRIARESISRYGISKNDLLVLSKSADELTAFRNSLYRLSPQGGGGYEAITIMNETTVEIASYDIGPDNLIYLFGKDPAVLYRLLDNGDLLKVHDDPIFRAASGDYRMVFFPPLQSFFIIQDARKRLYEVNIDGTVANMSDCNYRIKDIALSSGGNQLYLVVDLESFGYSSIQSLQYVVDRMKELEAGDFNSDGVFDRADFVDLIDVYLTSKNLRATEMKYLDLNGDGVVTPQDVQDLWVKMNLQ